MINPGDYNKEISIYRIIKKEDDAGFETKENQIILSTFAKIKTTKGFTLIANNSDFEKAYTNFTIRYSKKVEDCYYSEETNRKMYVDFKGKKYKLEYLNNVDEANVELEMQCKRVDK